MTDVERETDELMAHVQGPGTLLRLAREARGMTVAEVAASLKMSPRRIEAIEAEDFSRLSGATFVRGFVRNYAKLLKIDPAQVLAAVDAQNPLPAAEFAAPTDAGVRMPTGADRQGRTALVATLFALALLGVAIAMYFDVIDSSMLVGRFGSARVSAPPAAPAQPLEAPAATIVAEVQPEAPVVLPTPVPASPSPSEPQAASSSVGQIVFSFDGESWTEVKDASGQTIFSQMNAKGTTQAVRGRPPFRVVVGSASNVRLQYGDQAIDLRPHTRVDVARLTLD